jgi:hypothetical protein
LRRWARGSSRDTYTVVGVGPETTAILFNGGVPLKEVIKVECLVLGNDLGASVSLDSLVERRTCVDETVLSGAGLGVLGRLRLSSFGGCNLGRIVITRHPVVDLDTVGVADLNARAVILDAGVLDRKEKRSATRTNKVASK